MAPPRPPRATILEVFGGANGHKDDARPSSSGQGQPLPAQLRSKMEGGLGADFSAVRVHEDTRAASLGALAFTQGTDIHFAPGQYQSDTLKGQELIGHELAHVTQQAQGRVQTTGQAKGVAINNDPALEREADVMGQQAAHGGRTDAPCGGCGACATCGSQQVAVQRKVETPVLQLQAGSISNGPEDPCMDLLQQIFEILEIVAMKYNEAIDDNNNLYEDPDYGGRGSWEGHRDNYNFERGRLRVTLEEWKIKVEKNEDGCGNFQLDREQQEELDEANLFAYDKSKDFPNKPAPSMYSDLWDKIATILAVAGLSLALIPEILVDVVDPEPATKLLSIGLTTATVSAILALVGKQPSDNASTAAVDPQLLNGDNTAASASAVDSQLLNGDNTATSTADSVFNEQPVSVGDPVA